MTYRPSGQRKHATGESGTRNFRYEAAKEGLGKLLEAGVAIGGAAFGSMLGTLANRLDLPLPQTAAPYVGTVLGGALGILGKAGITTALDRAKQQRATTPDADAEPLSSPFTRPEAVGPLIRAVRTELGRLIEQIDRLCGQLGTLASDMRSTQKALVTTMSGTRQRGTQRETNHRLGSARDNLAESLTLLHSAHRDIRHYRSQL
jgi:hypothetical protein